MCGIGSLCVWHIAKHGGDLQHRHIRQGTESRAANSAGSTGQGSQSKGDGNGTQGMWGGRKGTPARNVGLTIVDSKLCILVTTNMCLVPNTCSKSKKCIWLTIVTALNKNT